MCDLLQQKKRFVWCVSSNANVVKELVDRYDSYVTIVSNVEPPYSKLQCPWKRLRIKPNSVIVLDDLTQLTPYNAKRLKPIVDLAKLVVGFSPTKPSRLAIRLISDNVEQFGLYVHSELTRSIPRVVYMERNASHTTWAGETWSSHGMSAHASHVNWGNMHHFATEAALAKASRLREIIAPDASVQVIAHNPAVTKCLVQGGYCVGKHVNYSKKTIVFLEMRMHYLVEVFQPLCAIWVLLTKSSDDVFNLNAF
jgi:hypothetical protein